MRRTIIWLVHVGLPLGLGLTFYLAFRSLDVPILAWMARLEVVETIRSKTLPSVSHLPGYINDTFVDAMSAYALGAALTLVWDRDSQRPRWLALGFVVALGFEFAQWPDAVPGVFSWSDVVGIAIFYPLGVLLAHRTAISWLPKTLQPE